MKTHILLAEEDDELRATWVEALQAARFDVGQAGSLREALYRFCMQTPDIMVLNLKLPTTDSLAMLEIIREFQPNCPVVLIADSLNASQAGLRANLDILLSPPIEVRAVITLLQKLARQINPDGNDQGQEPEGILTTTESRRLRGGRHYRKRSQIPNRNISMSAPC